MQQPAGDEAFIAPGVPLSLPAPQRAEQLNRQQLLIASVKGKQYQLLTALEADQQGITLVGLMPTGARLFKVQYDQSGIHSERLIPLPGNALPPPAQVLADVMLCYWPLAEWQSRLPAGWQLVDEGMFAASPTLKARWSPRSAISTGKASASRSA